MFFPWALLFSSPLTRSGYWKVVALAFATATLSALLGIYDDFCVFAGCFVCWTPSSFQRERGRENHVNHLPKRISEDCLKANMEFEPVDISEAFGSDQNSFVKAKLLPSWRF